MAERSLERINAEIERRKNAASLGMLQLAYDLYDSFTLTKPSTLSKDESQKLDDVNSILDALLVPKFALIKASPRVPREKDKIKFLPGQHKGIYVEFVTDTGDYAGINLYGGLRDTSHGEFELKDTDKYMRIHHTQRTDRILSQLVNFNIHAKDMSSSKILADIWFTYSLDNKFDLRSVIVEGERIDVLLQLTREDPRFSELSGRLKNCSKVLTTLVPSAE